MSKLAAAPSSIVKTMGACFRHYPIIFKNIWLFALISAVLHLGGPFLIRKSPNVFIAWCLLGLLALLTWFLYTAILHRAQAALNEKPLSLTNALNMAIKQFMHVVLGNLIFLGIAAVIILLNIFYVQVVGMSNLLTWSNLVPAIVDIAIFLYIYFALPLIILDRTGVLLAFEDSLHLVAGNWWRTFIILLPIVILMVLFALVNYGFNSYYTSHYFFIIDFIYQLLFYPLIISVTLTMLNELKLRKRKPLL